MTGTVFFFGSIIGLIALILIVGIITLIAVKASSSKIRRTRNVYLGKLANTDSSIQKAMKYLKLTNSIKDFSNGEGKKR